MGSKVRFIAACVALLVPAVLLPVYSAHAQAEGYHVQIGAFHEGSPSETMRFLPSRLRVHQGDTITFSSESFHTATLLPAGVDAQSWVDDNVIPQDGPFAPFTADPDEGVGALKFNNAVAFPSNPTCGADTAPCAYDGSELVNSGVLVFGSGSFTTTIDAAPGESFWVICLVHQAMRMKVTVVDDAEPASSQAEIDAAAAEQVALDADEAAAMHHRLISKRSKHVTASGKRVWDAWVGFDLPGISLFAMYPKKLPIAKGDTVRYHFSSLEFEVHTATFPLAQGLEIANESFIPSCDPDGDAGLQPDGPPEVEGPPFCTDPSQLELDLDIRMMDHGDGVLRSASDFENSGVRGDFLSRASWDLKFRSKSPDKGFQYVCMIHPFMRGKVIVK